MSQITAFPNDMFRFWREATLDARLRTQLDEVGSALQELLPELEDEEGHGPQPVS